MTTAEQALDKAKQYVLENRPGNFVEKLLEDSTDYFAQLGTEGEWRLGESFIFIRKSDGVLWLGSMPETIDKASEMSEVP